MLKLINVSKIYAGKKILESVNLSLAPGEICLLLGGNGAGKSTLLKLSAGLTKLRNSEGQAGEIRFFKNHLSPAHARKIGFFGHEALLYEELNIQENLELFAKLSGVLEASFQQSFATWNIAELARKFPSQLSKGELARVSLARALVGNPLLILLDEPTASLDQKWTDVLLAELELRARSGAAILLATHDPQRLRDFASRSVYLNAGKLHCV